MLSKEIKSLILVLVGVLLFIFGFNFLKGTSLFDNELKLHTIYENAEGLQSGTPVTVNGLNVGKVNQIDFLNGSTSILVSFRIRGDLKFSKNSVAQLYEAGFIGGKSIAIIPKYDNTLILKSGDTLTSSVKSGLTKTISDRIVPLEEKIESILIQVDTLFLSLNSVLNQKGQRNLISIFDDLSQTMNSINSLTYSVDKTISNQSESINKSIENFNSISKNFKSISDSLSNANLKNVIDEFNILSINLNSVINKVKEGKGNLGKLIYEDSLYENLESSSKELQELLNDLKVNPKRYVHFSLFGKKEKNFKENKD